MSYRCFPPTGTGRRSGAGRVGGVDRRFRRNGRGGDRHNRHCEEKSKVKPTIVLVHGGYADSSC